MLAFELPVTFSVVNVLDPDKPSKVNIAASPVPEPEPIV